MRFNRRQITLGLTAALVGASTGCVTTPETDLLDKDVTDPKPSFLNRLPWVGDDDSDGQPEPYPNPVKLAATWTPDTLIQAGRTPTRGFGGRVFFYNEKSQAVPVNGTLTIHGFDENSEDPESGVKRFVLLLSNSHVIMGNPTSERLTVFGCPGMPSEASNAASHSSPHFNRWREEQFSIPATMLLPGRTGLDSSEKVARLSPQYRNYLAATRSESMPSSGLTTTTIHRKQTSRAASPSQPVMSIPNHRGEHSSIAGGTKSSLLKHPRSTDSRQMPTFLPASSGQ